jgi:hypothetical protein
MNGSNQDNTFDFVLLGEDGNCSFCRNVGRASTNAAQTWKPILYIVGSKM